MGSSPIPSAGTVIPTPGQPLPLQPGEWQGSASPTVVSFAKYDVNPPSLVYVQAGEQIVVNVNAAGNVADTVTVSARLLLPEPPHTGQPDGSGGPPPPSGAPSGAAITGQPAAPAAGPHRHSRGPTAVVEQLQITVPVVGGTPSTVSLALPEGFLLSVVAIGTTTPNRGTTFARIWLQQRPGPQGTIAPAMILVADYVTTTAPVGWPGGRFSTPTEGPGVLQEILVSQPAAGQDWRFIIPPNGRWRIQSANAIFVASGVTATRIPRIQLFGYAGLILWWAGPQQSIAAGQSVSVSASSAQVTTLIDPSSVLLPLPSPCFLAANEYIQTSTMGMQAGDQWSAIVLVVETWLDKI
jgi:hypothetical protein